MMARLETLFNAILQGRNGEVATIVEQEVGKGTDVKELLLESMIPAMREIGDRFSRNEAYVPEMLIAARAMQAGLKILEPVLASTGHVSPGKIYIGTVKGDLHDIGKNLVAMMVSGAGYQVVDLGIDCDVEKFKAAAAEGAQVIMLSALLTTTMPYMKEVINALSDTDVKIIVGGAPVTQEFADAIGAHGYAEDANKAVSAVEAVLAA
jgi:5-methyltetrahydrofolate--homocysteine methyltransferase